LRQELKRYYSTSIRTRIQKNINLLALEGKPAPAIDVHEFVGSQPRTLAQLRGTPVLLFFWAHWCGECKSEISVLAQIASEYGSRLAMVAPTQRYGFVAQGAEAPPAAELQYIGEVWREYYAPRLPAMQAPVSEEAFKNYGASTTPTIVLVDARGIIRLYHPGTMTYQELDRRLRPLLTAAPPATR
jgi:cytochrome c biogenesis protein CcmG/thiol:disulfide interchange protein DsbE